MDMNEVIEKIKDILASEGKNTKDIDVANALGINANTFAQMKFRNKVPYKEVMDFLSKKDISINLFFYNQELGDEDKRYKVLRMFDVKASLGGGAWNDDEEYEEVIMDKKIVNRFEKSNCSQSYPIDIISAMGESMEPYICDGDLCMIAVGMPFKDGNVYAINTPDGVVIKECYK
ncbi:peptidase S24 LexA-like protein [Campylobacter blaseri]|uniref:S24 family peptidase n=1 Tax=Campylobacter blaseri TaxID=2042961 RepID=UPI001F4D4997|nr:S24 family peptidase [Campylobacter blaseri]QKF86129.1 peptidase S24 LexA-like protein [Campylobacter blaseri]